YFDTARMEYYVSTSGCFHYYNKCSKCQSHDFLDTQGCIPYTLIPKNCVIKIVNEYHYKILKDNIMNKLKNIFPLFFVVFLALILFSCAKNIKHTPETNYQDDNLLNGLRIINYGNSDLPDPFDTVKYFIDGRKVASHSADKKFEKLILLPPGEHHLTVENGKYYNCKYSFKID